MDESRGRKNDQHEGEGEDEVALERGNETVELDGDNDREGVSEEQIRQDERVLEVLDGVWDERERSRLDPGDHSPERVDAVYNSSDEVQTALKGALSFMMWAVGYFGFMYIFFKFVVAFYHIFKVLPDWLGLSMFLMVLLPSFCVGFACFNISFAKDPILATVSLLIDAALISTLNGLQWPLLLSIMLIMFLTKPVIQRVVAKAGSWLSIDPIAAGLRQWEQRWRSEPPSNSARPDRESSVDDTHLTVEGDVDSRFRSHRGADDDDDRSLLGVP